MLIDDCNVPEKSIKNFLLTRRLRFSGNVHVFVCLLVCVHVCVHICKYMQLKANILPTIMSSQL